jgi:uncharacterized protein YegP (UPF0339 family)
MKLQIYEDNSSHFHWMLAADDGESLATSTETFASHTAALRAAKAAHKATSVTIEGA